MNTPRFDRMVLAAISLAIFAGSTEVTRAGNAPTPREAPRVIQLHAPNNTTSTIVVWATQAPRKTPADSVAGRRARSKSIGLPAGNSPVQSVTVCSEPARGTFEVAPLK